ncbi:UNVERIFIED_CONTAM: hypothetical protein HDU68_002030, partial [Siphonaria sp. JEL0065]
MAQLSELGRRIKLGIVNETRVNCIPYAEIPGNPHLVDSVKENLIGFIERSGRKT